MGDHINRNGSNIITKERKMNYKIRNETSYHADTPDIVAEIIDNARIAGQKIRLWYGSGGHTWPEEYDTVGYIGRSTGPIKVPLLLSRKTSIDGSTIIDHCICRIDVKNEKNQIITIYRDPKIMQYHYQVRGRGLEVWNIERNERYAICDTPQQAQRLTAFLNGNRWTI